MVQELFEILPAEVVKGIVMIVTILALMLLSMVMDYIAKLRRLMIQKIGQEKFNRMYELAKRVYYIVEQNYRKSEESGEKQKEFNSIFRTYFPEIGEDELNHLRESIVGEMKKG